MKRRICDEIWHVFFSVSNYCSRTVRYWANCHCNSLFSHPTKPTSISAQSPMSSNFFIAKSFHFFLPRWIEIFGGPLIPTESSNKIENNKVFIRKIPVGQTKQFSLAHQFFWWMSCTIFFLLIKHILLTWTTIQWFCRHLLGCWASSIQSVAHLFSIPVFHYLMWFRSHSSTTTCVWVGVWGMCDSESVACWYNLSV